jgi:hypothetical protein
MRLGSFRIWLGCTLITRGMSILPSAVRKRVRDVLMYHVPGALTDDEKRSVERWVHKGDRP